MSEIYRDFYTQYRSRLFGYLLYKSGDAEVARDIMQESFARHYRRYGNAAVSSPALLFTIARNALVDFTRNEKVFLRIDKIPVLSTADEESNFIARESVARIHQALERLPEQDRDILVLAVNGIAYKEIATILDLSLASVKVRVHRARRRLRNILAGEAK
ncbi:RNA polymerase sigma factor [Desulforhopalus singaporensis]|nr:sigma-70 family RNA polymerase sigma factor [Desulforhopalus singaporensis]